MLGSLATSWSFSLSPSKSIRSVVTDGLTCVFPNSKLHCYWQSYRIELLVSISIGENKTMGERNEASRTRRRPLVGAQVRRLRTDRGLTLAQVGELADLNVSYLSQVENDKASPSLETLAAIADVFEVPITWLLVDAAPAPRVVRRHERRGETPPHRTPPGKGERGLAPAPRAGAGGAPPG